ncbi:MAG: restriction endonuclease [Bacteroidota bacterium]
MSKRTKTSERDLTLGIISILVIGTIFWNNLKQGEWWAITIVVVLGLALIGVISFYSYRIYKRITISRETKKLGKSPLPTIKEIDKMNGEEFEDFLSDLYARHGYKVKTTPNNDQGADLIIKKNQKKVAIQAKRYDTPVGNHAVQEVIGAKRYYKADEAAVVTNSERFTAAATRLAKKNDVRLIERKKLLKLMRSM